MAKKNTAKTVVTLKHDADKRKNIPTAEFQSVITTNEQKPVEKRYPRNTDLDPQLVWRGKDEQYWSDLFGGCYMEAAMGTAADAVRRVCGWGGTA